MTTLDRYIIRQFLVNYLVLLAVLMSLIVLLDVIINLDELVEVGGAADIGLAARIVSTAMRLVDFYLPMCLFFFVYVAGLVAILAAGFTLASLIRNRELVAMLAGGVSLYRVAMPIFAMGLAGQLLLIADQEWALPAVAHKVGRSHAEAAQGKAKSVSIHFVPDGQNALFTAHSFDADVGTMTDVSILQRDERGQTVARITAVQAIWDPSRQGWELVNAFAAPTRIAGQLQSSEAGGAGTTVAQPVEFIATDLDPTTIVLRQNAHLRQLLSIGQLGDLEDKPHIVDPHEIRRIRHSRISLPLMNMMILAMGLPFFLIRVPGNLLMQSIKGLLVCIPAWGGGFVTLYISTTAVPPAVIAYLPIAAFVPVAFYLMDNLET
jgi:lipopolysaccharide export system permease protein